MQTSNAITSEQVRAARAFLGLSQAELADEAGIALRTVIAVEAGTPVRPMNLTAVCSVLVRRGIVFVEHDGKVGVVGPRSNSEPDARRPSDIQ